MWLLQPHFGVPALFWKAPILLLIDHLAPFVWCSSVKKPGVSFVDYYNSWSKSRLYNNDGKYYVFTFVLIVIIFILTCFKVWNCFSTITNVVFQLQNYLHFYESKDLIVEKWNRKLDVVDVGQKLFKTSTPISSTQKGALRKKFWWLSKSKNWISLWKKHPRKTLYYNFLYTGTKQFCSILVWKVIWHQI